MAAFPICADEKGPELAGPSSKSATGSLHTAKISVKYKSEVSHIVKWSSHSDSAVAADDHDDLSLIHI